MLLSEQLSSFSEQLFGILRAQSGHAYPSGYARRSNNLLISTVRAVRGNIQPRSCCINLAIARSTQQDFN
jgi:hypothetical protein